MFGRLMLAFEDASKRMAFQKFIYHWSHDSRCLDIGATEVELVSIPKKKNTDTGFSFFSL